MPGSWTTRRSGGRAAAAEDCDRGTRRPRQSPVVAARSNRARDEARAPHVPTASCWWPSASGRATRPAEQCARESTYMRAYMHARTRTRSSVRVGMKLVSMKVVARIVALISSAPLMSLSKSETSMRHCASDCACLMRLACGWPVVLRLNVRTLLPAAAARDANNIISFEIHLRVDWDEMRQRS